MKSLRLRIVAATLAVAGLFALGIASSAQATFYPRNYLASLHYYASADFWVEHVFPVRGSFAKLMNSSRDFNLDGGINVEDDLEMVCPYKIGYPVTGTTKEGYVITSSYPNDQRPAVYFHRVPMSNGFECWEYWTYYADNDVTIDQHEHDWEFYFIYLHNGSPYSTRVSFHGAALWYAWSDWTAVGKIEATSHLKIGVQGGYHCIDPAYQALPNGVRIKYDGYINKRNGRLDYGDNTTYTYYVFCNDSGAASVTTYSQSPSYYWGGDNAYGSAELGGMSIEPPWNRSEGYWNNPPSPDM
jgi:hypothetical protein